MTRSSPYAFTVDDPRVEPMPETGCWLWSGAVDRKGRGRTAAYRPHRAFYQKARGPIERGHVINHDCQELSCCNPDHMRAELPRRGTVEDRFFEKVAKTDSCWLWRGAKGKKGYGLFYVGGESYNEYAHRASWQMYRGPIPDGMFVCHHCDIPSCVNPAHLFLGTPSDNMVDSVLKGRHRNQNTGKVLCKNGHAFTLDNTYVQPNKGRVCRTCTRLAWARKAADPEWVAARERKRRARKAANRRGV